MSNEKDHAAEVSRLEARVAELETVAEAWHSVFGSRQLTHAHDRLQSAERDRDSLRAQLEVAKAETDYATRKLTAEEKLTKALRHAQLTAQPDGVPFVAYSTDEKGYPHMEMDKQGRGRLLCIQPTTASQGITVHGTTPAASTPPEGKVQRLLDAGDWMASRCTDPQAVDAWHQGVQALAAPAPACKTCDYLDFYGNHPTDCPDCNAGEGEK